MDFKLTNEQLAIQSAMRTFVEKELAPGVMERDERSEFPLEQFKALGKAGLNGIQYPKEYGGQDGDYISYAIAVEELSKVDGSIGIAYSVNASLYAYPVFKYGSEEIKKKYLPPVFNGTSLGAFGLTEPNAGSDAGGCVTVAKKEGDYYVLNGAKCFSTNGPLADYYVVFALTEPEKGAKGLSAFVIETAWEGVSVGHIEDKMGIRSAKVSEMFLKDVKVPAANLLGEEGQGFKIAMQTLDGGRIGVAAQGLGLAKGAFEIARKYMMDRKQFGKPICAQQYPAFKMAELKTKIEYSELLLYKAAQAETEHLPYTIPAAMAKLTCTDTAMEVTTQAVQFLGGNGYMKDYHVERMMRDAKITQIYEGTNKIQKLIISGSIFR